jgi:hypothetical protein
MPRSIAIEGKWMLRVRAVDQHHLVKGALTGVGKTSPHAVGRP